MDELVMRSGSQEGLLISLALEAASSAQTAAEGTRGTLHLSLRGAVLWHGQDDRQGFAWSWVEMLELLAQAWPHLAWEDGLPLGLRPDDPAMVLAQAANRWKDVPGPRRDEEEASLEAFQEVHDLARAVQGAVLPPVWVVREGLGCWVCGGGRAVLRPHAEVMATLAELGQALAGRLAGLSDARARAAVEAWKAREAVEAELAVRIATGLEEEALRLVRGNRSLESAWELEPSFAPNELLAVARMGRELAPSVISSLVEHVRRSERARTPELDRLGEEARTPLAQASGEPPFEQGYVVAEWLRSRPGIVGGAGRVDPGALLGRWGVGMSRVDLPSDLDGFACWGPRHGPAVFLNRPGRHNRSPGGLNATIAHEICHLLLDRSGALPMGEVLGGRASPLIEARAGAFAAELLMPRAIAGRSMAEARDDPRAAARKLRRTFAVSLEVVAWQARNSWIPLPDDVHQFLKNSVSRPDEY